MLAYLYLSRRTLTGEVFPASSSTGEAASRARPLSTQSWAPATQTLFLRSVRGRGQSHGEWSWHGATYRRTAAADT